jgi:hypothetical protein
MKILEYQLMKKAVKWWGEQPLLARRIELFIGFIVLIGIMLIPVEWGMVTIPLFIPLMIYGFFIATIALILYLLWWLAIKIIED